MGRKEKSKAKGRLDKFYHIAKEQGYRSRASFKLIQINKKYNFLQKARIVVDLCAAPGSWLQVCSKYMGSDSIIIGLDLDPIKHIPKVKSFQQDITAPECISLIRREIKTAKVDVVLNDGAPNVGANWKKDAFTQSELVLHSLALACKVLRKGGTFVTKVFRSADYNSLVWAMNKFFDKVEACKPDASRHTSAEIFLVGLRFQAPDFIDKRFFDSSFVFKDNEHSLLQLLTSKEVNSIEKVFVKRNMKRRVIEDAPMNMFRRITFQQFIDADNPYPIFVDFNQITIDDEQKEKYLKMAKAPKDYEDILNDLLLLGKREVSILLKWRTRIRGAQESKSKAEDRKKKALFEKKEVDGKDPDGFEDEEELQEELDKIKLKNDRRKVKQREKRLAAYAKQGLLPGEEGMVQFDQEVTGFNFQKHGALLRKGKVYDAHDSDEEKEEQERLQKLGGRFHVYKQKEEKEYSFREMEDQMEKEYEMHKKVKGNSYQMQRQKEKERRQKSQMEQGTTPVTAEEKQLRLQNPDASQLKKRVLEELRGEDESSIPLDDLQKSRFFDRDSFKVLGLHKKLKVDDKFDAPDSSDEEDEGQANSKSMVQEGLPVINSMVQEEEVEAEDFEDDEEQDQEQEGEIDEEEDDDDELSEADLEDTSQGGNPDFEEYMDQEIDLKKAYLEDMAISGMSKKDIKREQIRLKIKRKKEQRQKMEQEKKEGQQGSDKSASDAEDGVLYKNVMDVGEGNYADADYLDPNEDDSDDPFKDQEYDGRYDLKLPLSEREKRKKYLKKLAKKKEKREPSKKQVIEVVPAKKFEDYDADELAEDLALARKMLRKKDRLKILDIGINKFNYLDDPEDLPRWFMEDERKHTQVNIPITKEDVIAEKKRLKLLNAQPPKKVMEAKIRKKIRLVREMKKFKDKADDIYQTEGMDQKTKMREIEKMKNKLKNKSGSTRKQVVVAKNRGSIGPSSGKKTQGRKYKVVDRRLKNDIKAQKRAQKRNYGRGGPKGPGSKRGKSSSGNSQKRFTKRRQL